MAEPSSRCFYPAAVLLVVALLFGGTARALNDLLVLFAALPLLFCLLTERGAPRLTWTARMALGLLAIACLQLVPLPPSVWTSLPGRELAAASLAASGQASGWRPIALDPFASTVSLLAVAAPLIIHVGATRLTLREVRKLMALISVGAIASAILGIVQYLSGGIALYHTEHSGAALGLFANRNHHADFLLIGMLFLTALAPSERIGALRVPTTALIVLLGFAVIATTSRAGIALAIPVGLVALTLVWRPGKRGAVWLAGGALAGVLALVSVPVFSPIFDRFGDVASDQRITMARDSLAATRAMWPFGSGWGSFVPVYKAFEDLDMLEARYVVAAHNDYLQLALEGGIAGVLVSVAGPLALAALGWHLASRRAPALAWAAWCGAGLLLVHSAFDFPLRTGTLAVLFGFCTAAAQSEGGRLRVKRQSGK